MDPHGEGAAQADTDRPLLRYPGGQPTVAVMTRAPCVRAPSHWIQSRVGRCIECTVAVADALALDSSDCVARVCRRLRIIDCPRWHID